MTSCYAVALAAVFQMCFKVSFFLEQSTDQCSPAPALSSYIFLIALLDILYDITIYPIRYMHLPYGCQVIAETILTVLLTEFGCLIVWCSLERVFCHLIKSLVLIIGFKVPTFHSYEFYILGFFTILFSGTILIFTALATDHVHLIKQQYLMWERKTYRKLDRLWKRLFPKKRKKSNNDLCYEGLVDSSVDDYKFGRCRQRSCLRKQSRSRIRRC